MALDMVKAVKDEKETKRRLLESAKKEFLEKGYLQASLRSICKNAGVTTGALYFFFEGKEALFAELVEEPLQILKKIMLRHYEDEMQQITTAEQQKEDHMDDTEASMQIIHYLYQNYDAFQLLVNKSTGSRFEHTIDEFVEFTQKHYAHYAKLLQKHKGYEPVSEYLIHWIAHMQVDVFIHLLTHVSSEEEAQQYIRPIVTYLRGGWDALFTEH